MRKVKVMVDEATYKALQDMAAYFEVAINEFVELLLIETILGVIKLKPNTVSVITEIKQPTVEFIAHIDNETYEALEELRIMLSTNSEPTITQLITSAIYHGLQSFLYKVETGKKANYIE